MNVVDAEYKVLEEKMRVEKSQFLLKKESYRFKTESKSELMLSFTAKKIPKYKSGSYLIELVELAKERIKALRGNGGKIKEALDEVYKNFPELNQSEKK